ncbi:MAG: magnesium/cobalt transporter CorA [Spirochaetales bacterium]|nr:magnesium/cobalt transporter CorA [Spirochaetales bacterium]
MKKYRSKDKLPPGTVRRNLPAGTPENNVFEVYAWDQEILQKYELSIEDLKNHEFPKKLTVWLHYPDTANAEALEAAGERFNIHSLVLEDIQNDDHRPKMDDYPEFNFIIQKQLIWDETRRKIIDYHLAYIYMKDMVISFGHNDPFDVIRERLEKKQGKIREKKADYLLFCLLDVVGDEYFAAVDRLETLLDELEDEMSSIKTRPDISVILNFKKQLIHLKRNVKPLKTAVEMVRKSQAPPIQESSRLFYRDLSDHLLQLIETLDVLVLSTDSLVSLALNMAGHQANSVMKVLTIIATIFIPLTFIAGIYGMNFRFMPELAVPWAYPAVLGVMAVIGVVMMIIFKKNKWF